MATLEQEAQQRQELKTALAGLVSFQPESLVRAEELGKEVNFAAGLPVFQRTLGLFKDLSDSNLDNIPFEVSQNLTSLAKQVFAQFQQIQNFSVQQNPSNPVAVRDQLINQIRDQWYSYYSAISPVIAYSIRRGTDFDALEREARGTAALLKQMEPEMRAEKDKSLAEMESALEKVRQAAAEAGVAQHAIHFQQEAESHRKQSRLWLVAAVLFAGGIVLYAIYSLEIQLHDIALSLPTAALIPIAVARVLVISILSYGLLFCARNYGASRHNFVINRHRQNALSSFETFVKASGDVQTKDAVLLQATQSIFIPQPSGYLKVEGELQPSGQIIEVIRRLTGTKD